MGFLNTAIRTGVKVALSAQIIERMNLSMPPLPIIPTFNMPPKPDISDLPEKVEVQDTEGRLKIKDDLMSEYITEEYKSAENLYYDLVIQFTNELMDTDEYKSLDSAITNLNDLEDQFYKDSEAHTNEVSKLVKNSRAAQYNGNNISDLVNYVNTLSNNDIGEEEDTVGLNELNTEWRKKISEYNKKKYKLTLDISNLKSKYDILEKKAIKMAREYSEIDSVPKYRAMTPDEKYKFKTDLKSATEKEKKIKQENRKAELESFMKSQYGKYVQKEIDKWKDMVFDYVDGWKSEMRRIKTAISTIEEYWTSGAGSDEVEEKCDEIERVFSNLKADFKIAMTDVQTLVTVIATTDTIVVGTAAGVPNPFYKISFFLSYFSIAMSSITKCANDVKEILAIALSIGLTIESISEFAKMMKSVTDMQDKLDKLFSKIASLFKKKSKWVCKNDPDDEDSSKTAGYMVPDIEVDEENKTIILHGMKCYCTKRNNKTTSGKWLNENMEEVYQKGHGDRTDESGKNYYYLTENQLYPDNSEYTTENEQDYNPESADNSTATILPSLFGTTLQLADGRTIVIDYEAQSGDIIHLNDGSIITVN